MEISANFKLDKKVQYRAVFFYLCGKKSTLLS